MKIYELLFLCEKVIRCLSECGIRTSDYRYTDLFREYTDMKHKGHKTTYVVAFLAEKYGISERKTYELIKRLASDCDTGIFLRGGVNGKSLQ